MFLVSLLLGLLVLVTGMLAVQLAQTRKHMDAGFTDLRDEIATIQRNQTAHDQDLIWRTSPLSELEFYVAAEVAWLPSSATVFRYEKEGQTILLKSPQISDAGDKIELVVEIIEKGQKLFGESSIQVDIATACLSQVSPTSAASESVVASIEVNADGPARTIDFLGHMPEFIAKLPDLLVSCLTPLAHYLSGLDTARKLAAANQKLDFLIRGRIIEQQARVERIWMRANETIKNGKPQPESLARLVWYRDQLLELRLTWIGEMTFHLNTAPNVIAAIRQRRASRLFCQHVFPIAQKAKLLQIALFTDYCLALSTNTLIGFHQSLRQEVRRVEKLAEEFRAREKTLRGDEARAHSKRIGDVLEAYRDFLTAMASNGIGATQNPLG